MFPRALPLLAAVVLAVAPSVPAQIRHQRGDGELLLPALRVVNPAPLGIEVDLTQAEFLWAFHRDSLLPARQTEPLLPATVAAVAGALLAASRAADEELAAQSLWALARLAQHHAAVAAELHARVIGDGLLARPGRLGEVAAVGVGLGARGDGKVMAALAAIATDKGAPARLRAFAFYGLGLAAQESADVKTQFRVLAAVERALLVAGDAAPEVRVASLHALALVRIDAAPSLAAPAFVLLERAWAEEPAAAPIQFRAHVPIAVASLLRSDDEAAKPWRERLAAAAAEKSVAVQRSCVLALGTLCRPWQDGLSPDGRFGEQLRELATNARDAQVRFYAMFAMGQIGGAQHRAWLLEKLAKRRMLDTPWLGLGLAAGVARSGAADKEVTAAIEAALATIKAPNVRTELEAALRVARGGPVPDAGTDFRERYGTPLTVTGIGELVATLSDGTQSVAHRSLAAVALGHLADTSPRHWSARLARAVDYRSGTAELLGQPGGVLRLP